MTVRGKPPKAISAIASRCSGAVSDGVLCQAWPVGNIAQLVQLQLFDGRLGERDMGHVRRIEGSAEHADAQRAAQTQSLRTRNFL